MLTTFFIMLHNFMINLLRGYGMILVCMEFCWVIHLRLRILMG